MTRAEADDRYRASRRDAFGGSGSPARLTRQHAEDGSFIDGVGKVAGLDAKDDLLCGDTVAFSKGPDFPVGRQDLAQERDDLLHATEQTIARGKELHAGDGVEASCLHSLTRPHEIAVSRVAGDDWLCCCEEMCAHW